MKFNPVLATVALGATLGLAGTAHSATYVYDLVGSLTSGEATGSITTDTNSGVVALADIASWNITVDAGNGAVNLNTSNSSISGNYSNGITATASGLFFDFSGSPTQYIEFNDTSNNQVQILQRTAGLRDRIRTSRYPSEQRRRPLLLHRIPGDRVDSAHRRTRAGRLGNDVSRLRGPWLRRLPQGKRQRRFSRVSDFSFSNWDGPPQGGLSFWADRKVRGPLGRSDSVATPTANARFLRILSVGGPTGNGSSGSEAEVQTDSLPVRV